MFKVIKGNQEMALLKNPEWIRVQENGYFGLCKETQGIVIKQEKIVKGNIVVEDVVYNIEDKPEIEDAETVTVYEVDDGMYLFETMQKQNNLKLI